MKSVLYVAIATIFISITPFLALFNPDCVPTRGLLIYSVFFILLIFTIAKEHSRHNKKMTYVIYAITYILCSAISWIDLYSIITLLKKGLGFYSLIPLVTPAIALLMIKDVKQIPLKNINLAMFSVFFFHLAASNSNIGIEILSFTLFDFLN